MLRVGFFGAGGIALAHAIALARIQGARIEAAADPVLERAEAITSEFGGRAFGDFHQMFDHVDVVWVCTPPFLHRDHAVACLNAGKHVFLEKPIALKLDDADVILAAAQKNKVKLAVGEMIRFYPVYREMKRLIGSGAIGTPTCVWSRRYESSDLAFDPPWRWDPTKSGGYIMEWQTHEINTVRYIGGNVVSVCAQVHFSPRLPNYDVTMHSLIEFENGATGVVDGSVQFAYPFIERGAMGTEATIIARDDETLAIRRLDNQEERSYRAPIAAHEGEHGRTTLRRVLENQDFIGAIEEDRAPLMSGEEARADLEVALAVHQSSAEKRMVRLPLRK
ncbi:MAG TPA: Gfo/Idh/MocA family oxidoreductase [Acidobacteriota bacterium]|jgi:predicted dehydrogenase